MRYKDKWSNEVVEAIKWDGNIETIKNNKWLENAITDNEIILAMDNIYDKNPVLLYIQDILVDKKITEIKKGDYIIKCIYNKDYKIKVTSPYYFNQGFDIIEVNEKDKTEKVNIENNIYDFKVITKDIFISQHIEETYQIGEGFWEHIDRINKRWDKIAKGYNFILFKQDINNKIKRYYSVDDFNKIFKR